ncbi:MAG: DUF4126 domain-containing protein [Armatimonadetes bacterium]|nr:DUF4126 domain-containing protein [Armatimonadota bacterium]
MGFEHTLAVAMGASWVSGIKLYAGVAMLGLLSRFGQLQLPGNLEFLTSWWIIGLAAVLYVIEFLADKIPLIDSMWDTFHTFIRIPAGAALAFAAFGKYDAIIQGIAFLLGGGIAASSHGTKSLTRAAINTSPEPFSNITASLIEDGVAVGAIALVAYYPVILIGVVVVAVIASLIVIPKMIRFLRNTIAGLSGPPGAT